MFNPILLMVEQLVMVGIGHTNNINRTCLPLFMVWIIIIKHKFLKYIEINSPFVNPFRLIPSCQNLKQVTNFQLKVVIMLEKLTSL